MDTKYSDWKREFIEHTTITTLGYLEEYLDRLKNYEPDDPDETEELGVLESNIKTNIYELFKKDLTEEEVLEALKPPHFNTKEDMKLIKELVSDSLRDYREAVSSWG